MFFDLGLAIVFLLLLVSGYFKGAFSQILTVIGLLLAFVFAKDIASIILHQFGISESGQFLVYLSSFFVGLFIYIVTRIVAMIVDKLLFAGNEVMKKGNRLFGAFIGAIKGIALVFVATVLLVVSEKEKVSFVIERDDWYKDSQLLKLTNQFPFVKNLEYTMFIEKLKYLYRNKEHELSSGNKRLEALVANGLIEKALGGTDEKLDPKMAANMEKKIIKDLYDDPEIRQLILSQ